MALDTVSGLVAQARVLVQDTVDAPYRYSDPDALAGLNLGLLEMRRLRFDAFLDTRASTPQYSAVDATQIAVDEMFLPALLYYTAGHMELQNSEEADSARASAFKTKFTEMLVLR